MTNTVLLSYIHLKLQEEIEFPDEGIWNPSDLPTFAAQWFPQVRATPEDVWLGSKIAICPLLCAANAARRLNSSRDTD